MMIKQVCVTCIIHEEHLSLQFIKFIYFLSVSVLDSVEELDSLLVLVGVAT
jgi:hypothetical protein